MNELIEHLAERATKEMDQEAFSEDMNIPAEWYHKFAELIVMECIGIVENLSPGYKDYRDQIEDAFRRDCVIEIKKRFGVE